MNRYLLSNDYEKFKKFKNMISADGNITNNVSVNNYTTYADTVKSYISEEELSLGDGLV